MDIRKTSIGRGIVLASMLALAGCSGSAAVTSSTNTTANTNVTSNITLTSTQAVVASRNLESLSLASVAESTAAVAASATGFVSFTGDLISSSGGSPSPSASPSATTSPSASPSASASPSTTPTASPSVAPSPPPGTPSTTNINTTINVDNSSNTTVVVQNVALAGGGTDKITLTFNGVVSQSADVGKAQQELRDSTRFKLRRHKHEISETVGGKQRTTVRDCDDTTPTRNCNFTMGSTNVAITATATIVNGVETGTGTMTDKITGATSPISFTLNADLSGTIKIDNLNGVGATLTLAAGGRVSGVVTTGNGQVAITSDASGTLKTQDGTASS